MNLSSWILGAVVIMVLALGVMVISKPSIVVNQPPVGAAAGPDMNGPYLSVDGVRTWYFKPALRSATTTPLNFKTPPATTTLSLGSGCTLTTASTSAKTGIVFAKALIPNATTTFLFAGNSVANGMATVVATTALDAFNIGPSQYVAMSMIGGAGVDSPAGSCSFQLREI